MGWRCGGKCSCDIVFVSPQPSGSEGQTGDEHEERERLRRVLKQMGRIKCPSEVCAPSLLLYLSCVLLFFTTLCVPVTTVCIVQLLCPSCHILFTPHLPVSILLLPFPQAPLFVSASFYFAPYFFLYYKPCS